MLLLTVVDSVHIIESLWYDIRVKQRGKRRGCIKLHILRDIDTGIILWFKNTGWNKHDSPVFRNMMKHLSEIGAVFGDKAYSSRKTCLACIYSTLQKQQRRMALRISLSILYRKCLFFNKTTFGKLSSQ